MDFADCFGANMGMGKEIQMDLAWDRENKEAYWDFLALAGRAEASEAPSDKVDRAVQVALANSGRVVTLEDRKD